MISPFLRQRTQESVLRLLFRATYIQGSNSVIARSSLLSWAQVWTFMKRTDLAEMNDPITRKLMMQCYNTCDKDRIRVWSDGGVESMLEVVSEA